MGRPSKHIRPGPIEDYLESFGWDIHMLSNMSGVPKQTLYNNLNGETPMSLANGLRIVAALNLADPDNKAIAVLQSIQDNYDTNNEE